MIDLIKQKIQKIKDTKKIAQERNVNNWFQCCYYSFIGIFTFSTLLSLLTILGIEQLEHGTALQGTLTMNIIWSVASAIPFIYTAILFFTVYEKVIILHIYIFERINKLIFKAWDKLDMIWFKKYRKSSPLTESMAKVQEKGTKWGSKLTKNQKRVFKFTVVTILVVGLLWMRAPMYTDIMDSWEKQSIIEKNEIGQLYKGVKIDGGKVSGIKSTVELDYSDSNSKLQVVELDDGSNKEKLLVVKNKDGTTMYQVFDKNGEE